MGFVRDYEGRDFDAVKAIHEASQIDYKFPDLSSPLFLVTKVFELDGRVRACGGLYLQVEAYLWLDGSDWASPADKLAVLVEIDAAGMREAWLKGINQAVLWLPPGMERFGERLVSDLGFSKDRDGWATYSKATK
jgi:hypothetical protein